MITLTREQISNTFLEEIEYQLTIQKQYISREETEAYLLLLDRYGTLIEREHIHERYMKAWPSTVSTYPRMDTPLPNTRDMMKGLWKA